MQKRFSTFRNSEISIDKINEWNFVSSFHKKLQPVQNNSYLAVIGTIREISHEELFYKLAL